jgi:hypothetical protein
MFGLQKQHTLDLLQNTMEIPTQKPNTIELEEITYKEKTIKKKPIKLVCFKFPIDDIITNITKLGTTKKQGENNREEKRNLNFFLKKGVGTKCNMNAIGSMNW